MKQKKNSPWIRRCLIVAAILAGIAIALYGIQYMKLDREFHHNRDYFGADTYRELFALEDARKDVAPVLELAEEAFSFIGTPEEARERFGLLSRYSCTAHEEAFREEHKLELIASKTSGTQGYLWVAYVQACYEMGDECLSSSGSEEQRILSRWTLEQMDGQWTVTEIREMP